jgi:hypothetical protein
MAEGVMEELRPIYFRGGIVGYLRSKRFRKQWRKSLWKPGWKTDWDKGFDIFLKEWGETDAQNRR